MLTAAQKSPFFLDILLCNEMFAVPPVHHMILMYELGKHYRKTLSGASTVIQTD